MVRGVGFTGTSTGLTRRQLDTLSVELRWALHPAITDMTFHHGDCVGADESAHALVLALPLVVIHVHPPSDPKLRAFCRNANFTHVEKPYLKRNMDIVNSSSVLVACPKTRHEQLRSGTWATVRYAKKVGVKVVTIFPDGSIFRNR